MLRYDWFLSSDGTWREVREAYTGAPGLIEHRANVAPALGALFEQYAGNHAMTVWRQASHQLLDLAEAHHMTGAHHLVLLPRRARTASRP